MTNDKPLPLSEQHTPIDIVVLISGSGSNLQALIDSQLNGKLPIRIIAVISNKNNVKGLERALRNNIPTHVINHRGYKSRENFDNALQKLIDQVVTNNNTAKK